jgi:hypothetical protein
MSYMTYPESIAASNGCKVSWRTYETRAEAETCALAAKHNARLDEALGYDFGFATPGEIKETKDGLFEVTTP